ncbi:hypothetical protein THASP1DRAFT_30202 [Thamnocephalis sphaerospora]|uniref:Tetratricopeptide SHNi-TPR domain-containing protein n=1 Tax=Thamnocephalis sphaerospora TaxID=78915 RepID=A0A4P9XPP6_9FUNG|nr:hypothetical protein THASP1DRAFT_30202 [Thamnocephalis sphaerospora]|eukprot:RKP07983.1 hypothetical protein THASP1DRAFT_30202 [Thamnocephalis sphaerospora]
MDNTIAPTTVIAAMDGSFDTTAVDRHIKQGNRAFALAQYEDAVQEYGQASQLLGEHFGQDAPECADVLLLYGKALLHNAVQQNGVLGSQAGKAAASAEEQEEEMAQSAMPALAKILQFLGEPDMDGDDAQEDEEIVDTGEGSADATGSKEPEDQDDDNDDDDDDDDDDEDGGDGEEGEEGEEEDGEAQDEPGDDFGMAWEILDLARVIYSRQSTEQAKEKLGEVYMLLGDVSLESENFEQAVQDYGEALQIKTKLYANDDRRLAEAYYKHALSFEYTNKKDQAVEQLGAVADVLRRRLKLLRQEEEEKEAAASTDKGKQPADADAEPPTPSDKSNQAETADLQGLLTDIEAKIEDLRQKTVSVSQALQDGASAESAARRPATGGPVNDLTNLVRSTKKTASATADENGEGTGKRKADETETAAVSGTEEKRAKADA